MSSRERREIAAWSVAHAALALAALAISAEYGGVAVFAVAGAASLAHYAATVARPLTLASQVTAARAAMVCAAGVIGIARPLAAAIVLAVAALLDLVDGAVARRRGEVNAAGTTFDVEADAYLIAVATLIVVGLGRAGVWVLAPAALRSVLVLARHGRGTDGERRTGVGRAAFALLAAASIAACACPGAWTGWLLATAVAAVTASFAVDFRFLFGTQEYFRT